MRSLPFANLSLAWSPMEIIFHWCHLLRRSSFIEVVFHGGRLPSYETFCIVFSSKLINVCNQVLLDFSYFGHLSLRSSSMEVVFHGGRLHSFKILKIILSSTRVDLEMLQSKFSWFPAISLFFRAAAWVGVLIENKTNSAQLELELGLSLAKMLENVR